MICDNCKEKIHPHRTISQNRLQRRWIKEAVQQLKDETEEQKRGWCKLEIGLPILCEDEAYRKAYEEIIRPLPYELKLKMMMVPIDYPVTRGMNTEQKSRYLNAVYQHFTAQSVKLTEPPQHPAWI